MPLGKFIISSGEIPASSDAAKFFPVFSASSQPVEIQFIQYYGGDSGEFAQLILVPPTIVINGTTGTADHPGCIAITPAAYFAGAYATQASPNGLGSDNGGRGGPRFEKFVVPPNYQIAIQQDTANTAAWSVTVGGFELDY
jgi:hypothetical protein